MSIQSMLSELNHASCGSAHERLAVELAYSAMVCEGDETLQALIANAVERALDYQKQNGCISMPFVREIEQSLSVLSPLCKQYQWLLAGHAHIDMNWMWGYDETVSIVLDTFHTVMNLMERHPQFVFSQSQASTYAIVEKYDPELLKQIKQKIREGRWEVTACTWVEADHNLPSLESELAHLLYTKRYLSRLLDIPMNSLDLDFEPDTFGHNNFLPDVYAQGGVKYFYHCRGEKNESLYRWRGKNGHEVITLCEPDWYNNTISANLALRVPEFCRQYHMKAMMTVYGVGDHGGGPTHRDLNRIEEMAKWPLFPDVRYASFHDFFALAEEARFSLPVLEDERNVMFSGCYTSQSRIKRGNMMAERMLFQSELFGALSHLRLNAPCRQGLIEEAWRKVLFNQFHDIVTGSGKAETREYAMGEYQKVFATAGALKKSAYGALAAQTDTGAFASPEEEESIAEGAGVGYGVAQGIVSSVGRGSNRSRVFHLFNPLPFAREQTVTVAVWDCKEKTENLMFVNANGEEIPFQTLEQKYEEYWGHHVTHCLVRTHVPPCGYAVIGLRRRERDDFVPMGISAAFWRVEECETFVLENEILRAELDPSSLRLKRILDKRTGTLRELDGGFDFVMEDPSAGMTAWTVGRYVCITPVEKDSKARRGAFGPLRQSYDISACFGNNSVLHYTVSLDAGSDQLIYDMTCNWHEEGSSERGIPQLRYCLTMDHAPETFTYRVPGGIIERGAARQNRPSLGAIGGNGMALLCDSTYGYRGEDRSMSVSLVRGSYDPDPIPEKGEIRARIAVAIPQNVSLSRAYDSFAHPVDVWAGTAHGGTLPPKHSLMRMDAAHTVIAAVKMAQDDESLVVHLSNEGVQEEVTIVLDAVIHSVHRVDALEQEQGECAHQENCVRLTLKAYEIALLKIALA